METEEVIKKHRNTFKKIQRMMIVLLLLVFAGLLWLQFNNIMKLFQ